MNYRAEAVIDLDAVAANIAAVKSRVGSSQIMAVVKANAYGHGVEPVARQARLAGVDWLGVALPSEALALRAMGDAGRILAWLYTPGDPDIAACVQADIDLSVSAVWALDEVALAARSCGRVARIHLKVDTGLSRGGALPLEWAHLVAAAAACSDVRVVGVWSHLASSDEPDRSDTSEQQQVFEEALAVVRAEGIEPEVRHLANTGGALAHPSTHYDLVRLGIGMYGVSPGSGIGTSAQLGLVPAMTLRAHLALVKEIPSGASVSYGGTWTADQPTKIGLVPVGYADGIPRSASDRGVVLISGARRPILGRVAMDQFVVDVSGLDVKAGSEVIIFGTGHGGELTADEWAQSVGTIGYEIVTRISSRVLRRYVGGSHGWSA